MALANSLKNKIHKTIWCTIGIVIAIEQQNVVIGAGKALILLQVQHSVAHFG